MHVRKRRQILCTGRDPVQTSAMFLNELSLYLFVSIMVLVNSNVFLFIHFQVLNSRTNCPWEITNKEKRKAGKQQTIGK